MEVLLKRHTLTVDQYHQMFEVGIITERDKVELIKGEIITMSPKGSQHSHYLGQLVDFFYEVFKKEVIIRVQDPIRISNLSEPEPDITLCLPPRERYKEHHPTAKEVLLIVEVAHSSLGYDREVKLPLYAEAGIPEVWILDVVSKQLIVAKKPRGNQYTLIKTYTTEDSLTLGIGDAAYTLPLSSILG